LDWELAISRNREALQRIVIALFALAGVVEGKALDVLSRHLHWKILRVLRPAESAVRRLIMIAAHGLVLTPRAVRPAPIGLRGRVAAAFSPTFCLVDPLKRFRPYAADPEDFDLIEEQEIEQQDSAIPSLARISVPGLYDPFIPSDSSSNQSIDAKHLGRRLQALKFALENLPRQARRLARWQARHNLIRMQFPMRIVRQSPLRPGGAPGIRVRQSHEVDHVLRECHGLVLDQLAQADTS
jgi:hypothetical protein